MTTYRLHRRWSGLVVRVWLFPVWLWLDRPRVRG